MNPVEVVAVAFGLLAVGLQTREHIANWPAAIINVGLFFYIFWGAKLYADAVLQLVFLAFSVYGWWAWLYGGEQKSSLTITRASRRLWLIGIPAVLVFGIGLGTLLDRYTDSPVPYLDSLLTSASLLAQWMITRKILENWIVWIVANIVYVPMFIARGLPFTAGQYLVFLLLATIGYVQWKRVYAAAQFATLQGGPYAAPARGAP